MQGVLEIYYEFEQILKVVGHGPLHAAARRRRARRVHRRLHHPRVLARPGASSTSATRSSRPCSRTRATRPRRRRRVQDRHRSCPRRTATPTSRPSRPWSAADRGHLHHQPRGHGHLQPADRRVRQGRCTTPAPWLQRPGQRQRAPGHRPHARRRLRPVPLQPAQDVRHPARRRRSRPPAPWLPRGVGAVPAVPDRWTKDGDRYYLDYDRPESIGKIKGFLGSGWRSSAPTPGSVTMGPDGLRRSPRSACSTTTTSNC